MSDENRWTVYGAVGGLVAAVLVALVMGAISSQVMVPPFVAFLVGGAAGFVGVVVGWRTAERRSDRQ